MPPQSSISDLPAAAFLALREAFFDAQGNPRVFELRDKRNTQDDPFDEYVHTLFSERLAAGIACQKASGPLITPDLAILRPEICDGATRTSLATKLSGIVGLEVKKLERTVGGAVARASGLDYNTTPPCGTVRVYDRDNRPLDIRGFYLFVCQEPVPERPRHYQLSALTLCDGNLLNSDFEYYLSIVGSRKKKLGIGSYGDGADRARPMLIFVNPLGVSQLDHNVTLVHSRGDLATELPHLRHVGTIARTIPQESAGRSSTAVFHCYRRQSNIPQAHTPFELLDPFPVPSRTEETQARGRFRLDIQPSD